jgi:YqaJ-like viral recombinase domain
MIEILTPKSREEWLELRKHTIGASDVAAVLGAHPSMTPYELWWCKSNPSLPAIETKAMRRGRLLEDDCIEILREERPEWEIIHNIIPSTGGKFYRDLNTGISATPDAFADNGDGLGICQIKTVDPYVFHKQLPDRGGWKYDGEIMVPTYVAIQAIQEAHLTGASWACVAAFVGMNLDPHILDVPLNNGLMTRIGIEAVEFMRRIRENDPPAPDYARDAEAIRARYAEDDGGEIDLSGSERVRELMEERGSFQADEMQARIALEERKKIDAELIHILGNATRGSLGDGRYIEAATVRKKECVHKATTFRTIKIKQRRET